MEMLPFFTERFANPSSRTHASAGTRHPPLVDAVTWLGGTDVRVQNTPHRFRLRPS